MLFDLIFILIDTLILKPFAMLPIPDWNFLGSGAFDMVSGARSIWMTMDLYINMTVVLTSLKVLLSIALVFIPLRATIAIVKLVRGAG